MAMTLDEIDLALQSVTHPRPRRPRRIYSDLGSVLDELTVEREDFAQGRTTIGRWRVDPEAFVLAYEWRQTGRPKYRYEIPLDRCNGSAAVLDWIAHLSKKRWCSREDIGHLVEAFDRLLGLQQNFCSNGHDQPEKWRRKLKALKRGRKRTTKDRTRA